VTTVSGSGSGALATVVVTAGSGTYSSTEYNKKQLWFLVQDMLLETH